MSRSGSITASVLATLLVLAMVSGCGSALRSVPVAIENLPTPRVAIEPTPSLRGATALPMATNPGASGAAATVVDAGRWLFTSTLPVVATTNVVTAQEIDVGYDSFCVRFASDEIGCMGERLVNERMYSLGGLRLIRGVSGRVWAAEVGIVCAAQEHVLRCRRLGTGLVELTASGPIREIRPGFEFLCVRTDDGTECWDGKLGSLDQNSVPSRSVALSGDQWQAGESFVCGHRVDGSYRCEGSKHTNVSWSVGGASVVEMAEGYGDTICHCRGSCECHSTVGLSRDVSLDNMNVREIAVGGYGSVCALDQKGRVHCSAPSKFTEPWSGYLLLRGVTSIDASFTQFCAIAEDGVWCWSFGDSQLMIPSNDDRRNRSLPPQGASSVASDRNDLLCWEDEGGVGCASSWDGAEYYLPIRRPFDHIALGRERLCVVVDVGVICSRREEEYEHWRVAVSGNWPEPVQVVVGADEVCLRAASGEVFCEGQSGPLATAENLFKLQDSICFRTSETTECRGVADADPSLLQALAIGVGSVEYGGFGLTTEGEVFAWAGRELGVSRRTVIRGLSGTTQVIGENHWRCALRDGEVYCWGSNWRGMLGDGLLGDREFPAKVAGLGSVARLVELDSGACAIGFNGSNHCWGWPTKTSVFSDKVLPARFMTSVAQMRHPRAH